MRHPKLSILSSVLLAIGFVSTSASANVIKDPTFSNSDPFYAATDNDESSGIILTGGTITTSQAINAGGSETDQLKRSSFKITGENGTTVFKENITIRAGSRFTTAKKVNPTYSEIVIKNANFEKGGYLFAGNQNNADNNQIDTDETFVHLTNVASGGDLWVFGGHKTWYNANTIVNIKKSTVIIDQEAGGPNTKVNLVVGGSMIYGNTSQNGSWAKLGDSYVEIRKGVEVTDKVVGGNYIQYFGNAELTGSSTVVIDGASVANRVVGGHFVEYTETDPLIPGPEGSTAPRQGLSKAGTTSTVIVKNGSTVNDVVGGGFIHRGGSNDTEILLQSEASNVKVVVEDSTVKGNVIGGGMVNTSTGVGSVDVKESISVEIKNSNVDGIITTDSLDVSDSNNVVALDTSAKADNVSMKLTNVGGESNVIANKGSVELRAEDAGITSIGHFDVSDDVNVTLTANGKANDLAGGDVSQLIKVEKGSFDAKVNLEEGLVMGAISGDVIDGKLNEATVTEKTNSVMGSTLELASNMPLIMTRILTNDVRKRMGDLRASEGTSGAWARYDGGKLSSENGLDTDFHTIQVGIDTVPTPNSARFGLAFSYTDGKAENVRTQSDLSAFSLAGYATWMADNGLFVDGVVRMAKVDNDITVDGSQKGAMDNMVLSISGETGWRFDINDMFYVEPQAEVMYTYVDGDKFDIGTAQYSIDATDSLTGRLGFASGIKCPNNKGDLYVRASVVHEFLGDSQISGQTTGASRVLALDGKDTWIEYGLGGNLNLTKSTYLWADVERTSGSTVDTDYRATIGVRYAW